MCGRRSRHPRRPRPAFRATGATGSSGLTGLTGVSGATGAVGPDFVHGFSGTTAISATTDVGTAGSSTTASDVEQVVDTTSSFQHVYVTDTANNESLPNTATFAFEYATSLGGSLTNLGSCVINSAVFACSATLTPTALAAGDVVVLVVTLASNSHGNGIISWSAGP